MYKLNVIALLIVGCFCFSVCCYSQEQLLKPLPKDMKVTQAPLQTFIPPPAAHTTNAALLPPDFYTYNLGFFCRQELKLQQAHIPLVFRVGSMNDCNYLEQKPGYKDLDRK